MSFYKNFLSLCNSIGKTPSRVVLDIGLKKSAVTRWKSGGNPTDATAEKIADYFGVTVEDLLSEDESKPAPDQGSELTEVQREALAVIQEMSDDQLRVFIAAMKAARG